MATKSEGGLAEIKKALQAIVEDDGAEDDDKEKAKQALKALEGEDEDEKDKGRALAGSVLGTYVPKLRARNALASMTAAERGAFDKARAESESRARLTPEQRAMLDKTTRSRPPTGSPRATQAGSSLAMPAHVTPAQAAARVAELEKELG